jgi:hypothetical protein
LATTPIHGTDAEYQQAVFDIFPNLLRNTVLWPTFGNHDSCRRRHHLLQHLSLPQNAEAGGLTSERRTITPSITRTFILSPRLAGFQPLPGADARVARAGSRDFAKWIIAYWHHPPYTKGSHDPDFEIELVEMRGHVADPRGGRRGPRAVRT